MAVETSRIKGRLKELFPKANLSNKRLDEISARLAKKPVDNAEDSEIDTILNDMNDLYPFEEIAKDEHRLVTAENKAKNSKPANGNDQHPPADPPADPPKPTDDMPAWAKTMLEMNKSLKEDLETLKTGKIVESKKEGARKLFEKNETLKGLTETVKEKWFNRIDVNSETPIEDQISDLETEYSELVQTSANSRSSAGAPPNGSSNSKPTDAELDAVAAGL